MGVERPPFLEEGHLKYLDKLRKSGKTSMFGARPYLVREFGISLKEAGEILAYWMETFEESQVEEAKDDDGKGV